MSIYLGLAADTMNAYFPQLPWKIRISYGSHSRTFGNGPEKAGVLCHKEEPLRDLARFRLSSFLDRYVAGEVDFTGDIYSMVGVYQHLLHDKDWKVSWWNRVPYILPSIVPFSIRRKVWAVASHYDLPNEFILSYLDNRTRAYSSAIWKDPMNITEPHDENLEEAQHRKFHQAAEELEVQPDDKFLDIGCGYGYMVRLVETDFGCTDALGITLSKNQVETGFSNKLKRMHYLDLPPEGQFDKIYTCGMVSHLDKSELLRFYRHIFQLLKPGGRLWMHGIVMPPYGLDNYASLSALFSQKYIFPAHYQFAIHDHLKILEDLNFRVRKVYFQYGHYAKTLRHWYKRFLKNLPQTRHLITPAIERTWHLFLTYHSSYLSGSGNDRAVLDGRVSTIKQILATKD